MIELGIAWVLCGVIAGVVGQGKGQGCAGLLAGFLFGPLGIVLMLFTSGDRKRCVACKELVHKGATRCPKCQTELGAPEIREKYRKSKEEEERNSLIGFLFFVGMVTLIWAVGRYSGAW